MNQQDIAIVVISFDKYSDIWDTFSLCINRFWNPRRYKTYLINNTAQPQYDGIEVINTGKEIAWSHRMRTALEKIPEKYVILLLEDYLISETVDEEIVLKAINYMKDQDLDYLRIAPIPIMKNAKKGEFATPITSEMLYGVNLQAAIWKKSYLEKTLDKENFSAWEFEARQKFGETTRVEGRCFATNEFVIPYLNGIIQGKWYKKTIEDMNNIGIKIPLGDRSLMTDKDMTREKFRNMLLHHIPPNVIHALKPIAKKMGFKFVTK